MLKQITKNFKKPEGLIGKMILRRMNGSHSRVTDWGISFFHIQPQERVLDIGCGGGAAVSKMASLGAKVWGVDYSKTAVNEAMRNNAKNIKNGNVLIEQANVLHLPFKDGFFNFVTAFETVYFWPNWPDAFKEIARVMAKGACFGIVLEIVKDEAIRSMLQKDINMRIPKDGELEELLKGAGFSQIETYSAETNATSDRCIMSKKE